MGGHRVGDGVQQPGDIMLVHVLEPLQPLPYDWYAQTSADELPRRYFPEEAVPADLEWIDGLPGYTEGYERVWLVIWDTVPQVEGPLLDKLAETYQQQGDWAFTGLRLLLYEKISSAESPTAAAGR